MASLDHQLLKGSLDILLLTLLERGPRYGYEIVKEVRARSQGVLELKEGTLYPALHRLEQSGLSRATGRPAATAPTGATTA